MLSACCAFAREVSRNQRRELPSGIRGEPQRPDPAFGYHFDGGKLVPIADCFRCQPHVIKATHDFIEAFNPGRIPKLPPERMPDEGPRVMAHNAPSDKREAEIIASIVADGLDHGDVLVLLPRDDYAQPLMAELAKRHIAFQARGEQTSDATVIYAALQDWLADHRDNLAFRTLLQAIADSRTMGIPGPSVTKPETVAEREAALSKISAL